MIGRYSEVTSQYRRDLIEIEVAEFLSVLRTRSHSVFLLTPP